MSSCVSVATATEFTTITSETTLTSFSTSITTLPGTTQAFTTTACLLSASDGTCNSTTIGTSTTIISGGTSTTTVPIPITSTTLITTPVSTLFALTCSSTTPITTPPQQSSSSSTSSVVSTSTPPPTSVTIQSSSTLSDGSVSVSNVISVSQPSPSIVYVPTVVPVQQSLSPTSGGNSGSSNLGPILGGALGGFFGLLGIIGIIWYFWNRRRNSLEAYLDKYGDDEPTSTFRPFKSKRRFDIDSDANEPPKPYVYGLVGRAPNTPATPPPEAPIPMHTRTASLTPLMAPSSPGFASAGAESSQGHDNNTLSPNPATTSRTSSYASHLNQSATGHITQGLTSSGSHYSNEPGSPMQSPTSASHGSRPTLFVANEEPLLPATAGNSLDVGTSTSSPIPSPIPSRPEKSQRRSGQPTSPVVVHTDGGRLPAEDDAPPAYGSAL